jgi:hypothetical protein
VLALIPTDAFTAFIRRLAFVVDAVTNTPVCTVVVSPLHEMLAPITGASPNPRTAADDPLATG